MALCHPLMFGYKIFISYNKMEKVTLHVTQLDGALNVLQQEYPKMLNGSEVQ